MEIKDLAGLSEPLTRLIEVIAKGVGAVTASYLIRKNTKAKAHEIRLISQALRDVAQIQQLPVVYEDGKVAIWQKPEDRTLVLEEKPIEHRSQFRLDYQGRKEQSNIESVTSTAARELANDESVAVAPPDDDWITRFFKYAQEVSSEQMQDLWGRLLAGEIRRPGAYSLRTLELVKSMSQRESELFEHVGKLAITCPEIISGTCYETAFVDIHDLAWMKSDRTIHPSCRIELAESGLMHPLELALSTFQKTACKKECFFFGERVLVVERGEMATEVAVPMWSFTSVGRELLPLFPPHIDDTYLERLGKFFVDKKGKAFLAQTTKKHDDGHVEYDIIREIVKSEPSTPNAT